MDEQIDELLLAENKRGYDKIIGKLPVEKRKDFFFSISNQ